MAGVAYRSIIVHTGIALLVKACMVMLLIGEGHPGGTYGNWCSLMGDTGSYLEPAENLITRGSYTPDFRMPGYALPYLLCRALVPMHRVGDALVVAQTIMDAFATVALAVLAFRLTRSRLVFNGVFWCAVTGHMITQFDVSLLTESFTVAALIGTALFIVLFLDHGARWLLLPAGALFAWAVFMRPVVLIVLPAFVIPVFRAGMPSGRAVMHATLFCLPFALSEAAWVVRNAVVHQRFIPANTALLYSGISESPIGPVMAFVEAFGGRTTWWDPGSEIRFFGLDAGIRPGERAALPPEVVTPACPMDSLQLAADDLARWKRMRVDDPSRDGLGRSISERMLRYRDAYIAEHPWRHHVLAPLRCTWNFLAHSGTAGVFGAPWAALTGWQRALKAGWSLLFHVVQAAGLAACMAALVVRRLRRRIGLSAAFALMLAFVHPLLFRLSEHRYLVPALPWLLLAAWVVPAMLLRRPGSEGQQQA